MSILDIYLPNHPIGKVYSFQSKVNTVLVCGEFCLKMIKRDREKRSAEVCPTGSDVANKYWEMPEVAPHHLPDHHPPYVPSLTLSTLVHY